MTPFSMDYEFEKWLALYSKGKYDLARAAFEAGYKLAIQDINFFEMMKLPDTLVVPTEP